MLSIYLNDLLSADVQFVPVMNNFLSELVVYIDSQKMISPDLLCHAIQQTNLDILSRSDNRIGEYLNKYIVAIYDEGCENGLPLTFYSYYSFQICIAYF